MYFIIYKKKSPQADKRNVEMMVHFYKNPLNLFLAVISSQYTLLLISRVGENGPVEELEGPRGLSIQDDETECSPVTKR